MTTASYPSGAESSGPTSLGEVRDKGLKNGCLGLVSSVVIGVASTAPAYSLAATLGFVVAVVGPQSPIIVILAFVPILFIAVGYRELNRREPDCGTTFTWATKAFGSYTGWLGGWGIVAADILVMASLAQVAGQYGFLLFGADGIGSNPTSFWVLLVGCLWMVVMTWICYRGIELSANLQKVLLSIEITMLAVFAVVALIRVYTGHGASTSVHASWSWFNPTALPSFSAFSQGILLMIFIYWGWDSAVSVNEETADRERTPGRAAVLSTVILLVTYALVTVAAQSFAGIGASGIGLNNANNSGDVISVLGHAVFGNSTTGDVFTKLLILMVLSSAAASTQTTILPTARTTLSMAVYKAIPRVFARVHPRYLTPTWSTIGMGGISLVVYIVMNYLSSGNVIADSVSAIGLMIAFYYGLTGYACFWYYRHDLRDSARDLFYKGIIPLLGGIMLTLALIRTVYDDWHPDFGFTSWLMPFWPHWHIGGIFILGVGSMIVGVILMLIYRALRPPFFLGEVLNANTPVLAPEDAAVPTVDTAEVPAVETANPDSSSRA